MDKIVHLLEFPVVVLMTVRAEEAEQLVLAKPHVERPAGTLSRQNSPQPKLQASKKESSNVVHQEIIVDEDKYRVVLPRPIYSFFLHESTAPEDNPDSSRAKVVHTAMLLFAEYVDNRPRKGYHTDI